ncbi:hypothetical protein QJS10_CPA09g01667 [Acorus calamus]|uniref:Protein TIC 20 n=1 Tax=Acorus calamus TaxID=4465 RepID=A0AAV9E7C8_ACOCL|nr:hypothetical protein QJS10_CPA09g01667 [Acorus calamus]
MTASKRVRVDDGGGEGVVHSERGEAEDMIAPPCSESALVAPVSRISISAKRPPLTSPPCRVSLRSRLHKIPNALSISSSMMDSGIRFSGVERTPLRFPLCQVLFRDHQRQRIQHLGAGLASAPSLPALHTLRARMAGHNSLLVPRASLMSFRFDPYPKMIEKPKWYWRTLSCVPYLLPLHEAI